MIVELAELFMNSICKWWYNFINTAREAEHIDSPEQSLLEDRAL